MIREGRDAGTSGPVRPGSEGFPGCPRPLPITFLSDYGHADEFVGICHAVIERHCPGAGVIDLGHGIAPGDVRQGAHRLADSVVYARPGVHLAVVDPTVGSRRRSIAIRCGDRFLVGPDNGLLGPTCDRLGGAAEAFDISSTPVREEPVSATFHGRDIFAPVAAHLARGTPPVALGSSIGVETLVRLEPPALRLQDGGLVAEVVTIDRFGTASLAAGPDDLSAVSGGDGLPEVLEVRPAVDGESQPSEVGTTAVPIPVRRTFSDVPRGTPVILVDSAGRLALAVNGASAAERFDLTVGATVTLFQPSRRSYYRQ